jgi:hypothetical protein
MNRKVFSTILIFATATTFAIRGDDAPENPNRFSLGARFGFNLKAEFKNNGMFLANPGSAAAGMDHTYGDGYVRLDSSGDAGGRTWNWGYQNASQVAGDTMQFHGIQSSAANSSSGSTMAHEHSDKDDPQYGVELVYQRVLGKLLSCGRWGLEAGVAFTDLEVRANRSGSSVDTVVTDTYQLNGVVPPGAGYNGTFQGPGALLGDTPTRTTALGTSTLNGHQELSGQLFDFRLGPFAEWNFTPKLSLAGSVGLALATGPIDYNFSESATLADGSSYKAEGHSSKTDLLYGGYVSATLRYDFNACWGIYVGAQFQSLTELEQSVGGRSARLDPSAAIYGSLGLTFRF